MSDEAVVGEGVIACVMMTVVAPPVDFEAWSVGLGVMVTVAAAVAVLSAFTGLSIRKSAL